MKANKHVKLEIQDSAGNYIDYTEGLISIYTGTGIDSYEGPYQLPDTGQILITSRNKDLDPNTNQNIKFNSKIRVDLYDDKDDPTSDWKRIFLGYLSDINIEYRPYGEDPIITINGTDFIGQLQRYVLTDEDEQILKDYAVDIEESTEGCTIFGLHYLAQLRFEGLPILSTWGDLEAWPPVNPLVTSFPKAGDKFLDIFTKYCNSNLLQVTASTTYPYITFAPFYKDDFGNLAIEDFSGGQTVINNAIAAATKFAYDGSENPYKEIKISNGFDRSINQVIFSNSERNLDGTQIVETNTTEGPYNSTISYNQWATADVKIDTVVNSTLSTNEKYENLAYDIIESISTSNIEVSSITVDTLTSIDKVGLANAPILNADDAAYIDHKVSDDFTIQRLYTVCGAKYSITPTSITATYSLKVSSLYSLVENLSIKPVINLTPSTGDTNTDFSATVSNYNLSTVDYIGWDVAYQGRYNGWIFPESTSTDDIVGDETPTWDYDFGGISGDGYGPGDKTVRLWLKNSKKWNILKYSDQFAVTAAYPHADFSYSVAYGTVTFTDQSYDADSWIWDFGDGTTSNVQNPTHTYTTTGNKTVHLTVNNGVQQDTHTETIAITVIPIPVKWAMIEFNAVQTRPNSSTDWDKNLPLSIASFIPLGASFFNTTNTEKSSPKNTTGQTNAYNGNVYASYPNWTGLAPVGSGASDFTWYQLITDGGYGTATWMEIVPVSSNGGNTRTVNVKVYFKNEFAYNGGYGTTGFNGLFVTDRAGVGSALTYYQPGKTYEKIKVYISPSTETSFANIKNDTSSWVEVGYFQIANITSTEESNGYFYRSMTPIRVMPPQL